MKGEKGKAWTLISVFCGFLALMLVCFLVFPKAKMSKTERRVLAKQPEFTLDGILDGSFEEQTETYFADHFPFRRQFVSLEAHTRLYMGNNGAKGVYAGADGYLIPVPIEVEEEVLSANLSALEEFLNGVSVPCDFLAIPGAGAVLTEKLPANHGIYLDREILGRLQSELGDSVTFTDVFEILRQADRQVFYKTDHHWTTGGAYLIYAEYLREIGMEPLPETAFMVERHSGFYGTGYGKSGLWETEPDILELYRPPVDASTEILEGAHKESRKSGSMFFPEHLETGDMYSVFLDGNHSLTRVTNPEGKGKLLVLKDSFAHALTPFLAQHFERIDLVDLRYYAEPVSQLLAEEGYDRVLMVYSINSLCEAGGLVKLR